MGTILNGKYLSMPEQVQKNKSDIQIITEYIESGFKTEEVLRNDSATIERSLTNIPIDVSFGFLVDASGKMFKIIDVIGDIVYITYYTQLPAGQGFNYVGEFVSDSNEYYPYDLVMYQGSVYMAEVEIRDTTTPPSVDTTRWSLFVQGVNLNNYYTRTQIDNFLNNKLDKISSQKIISVPSVGGSTSYTLNLTEHLGTWTRFQAIINVCLNGGGTCLTLYDVNSINASQYFSEVTTNLGSKQLTISFNLTTKELTIEGLVAYSTMIIELLGTG